MLEKEGGDLKSGPDQGNPLSDIYHLLSSLPVKYRDKVCENLGYSVATFYRRRSSPIYKKGTKTEKGQRDFSKAEKMMLKAVTLEFIKELEATVNSLLDEPGGL